LAIPNALGKNTVGIEEGTTPGVAVSLFGKSMPATIGFQYKPGLGTIEIEIVTAERVLSAKLVSGKTPVSEQTPKLFFRLSLLATQLAGTLC